MRTILSPSVAACDPMASPGLSASTTLDRLRLGDVGCVVDITGDDAVAVRLLEMGLTPGVTVRVVGKAPFGDPLELALRSYRLSIRRAEAARVTIQ